MSLPIRTRTRIVTPTPTIITTITGHIRTPTLTTNGRIQLHDRRPAIPTTV
jgi:hypothetical protein